MRASGAVGELRVGYQPAALLSGWVLEATTFLSSVQFDVSAVVTQVDNFWITQSPMVLDLRFGRFHWMWESVRPQLVDGRLTVSVQGKPSIVKD